MTQITQDSIGRYLKQIGRVPLLNPEEEIKLAQQIQAMQPLLAQDQLTSAEEKRIKTGQKAKQKMIQANLRLVVSIAKKYQNRG